jgi:hypothetical protein
MGEAVGVGVLIVLPPLGAFAGVSKIDHFSHSAPRW